VAVAKKEIVLLGIEASGLTSGVYLSRDNQPLGEMALNIQNIHSRGLALFVAELLKLTDLSLLQISAVVVSAGPGSFTGLRIGYSIAKGIAHAVQKPLIEIPTLDIWAFQQGQSGFPVFSFIDAHRQEIFYALYRWEGKELTRITDYQIMTIESLPDLVHEKTIFVGPEIERLKNQLKDLLGQQAVLAHPIQQQIQGWALLQLGWLKFNSKQFSDLNSCEPLYLRPFKGIM
jgi:tRNA threonylcarbamoyladenosine biosynthesis protein TsaB